MYGRLCLSVWYQGAAFYVCFYIYLWRVFLAIENLLGIERQVYGNLQRVANVPTVGLKQFYRCFLHTHVTTIYSKLVFPSLERLPTFSL